MGEEERSLRHRSNDDGGGGGGGGHRDYVVKSSSALLVLTSLAAQVRTICVSTKLRITLLTELMAQNTSMHARMIQRARDPKPAGAGRFACEVHNARGHKFRGICLRHP